jgi:hypothetical protein
MYILFNASKKRLIGLFSKSSNKKLQLQMPRCKLKKADFTINPWSISPEPPFPIHA